MDVCMLTPHQLCHTCCDLILGQVSGEQNNAIWSSMGVQIGGLRSSYGVLGSWTTVFHEDNDPVGQYSLTRKRHS